MNFQKQFLLILYLPIYFWRCIHLFSLKSYQILIYFTMTIVDYDQLKFSNHYIHTGYFLTAKIIWSNSNILTISFKTAGLVSKK